MDRVSDDKRIELLLLVRNITQVLKSLNLTVSSNSSLGKLLNEAEELDDPNLQTRGQDNSNAWLYILFVLLFYAFSIVVLMVKYIRREREGSKLEFYYNEFVKRDWYKDKTMYDNIGRKIMYKKVSTFFR